MEGNQKLEARISTGLVNNNLKIRELRKFGLTLGVIFGLGLGIFLPLYKNKPLNIAFCIVGSILFLLGIFSPKWLEFPHKLWMKLGHLLGAINARIILFIVYVFTIIPISIILHLFRKDILSLRFDKTLLSYRQQSDPSPNSSMDRLF